MKKATLIISCLFVFGSLFGQHAKRNDKSGVIVCSQFGITEPLSKIFKEHPVDENKIYKEEESEDRENRKPQKFRKSVKDGPEYGNDITTIQNKMGEIPGRAPITNWAGQNATGFRPFDPSGASGPNNYVQMINSTTFKVYNKTTGAVTLTATLGNLWSPITANAGDPIVLYDKGADRWFLAQFGSSSDNKIYIAVSTTGDPTGSYYTYTFVSPAFPDYLKFSVWSDGYYMTSNQAQKVFAFERSAMLAGNAGARVIYTSFAPPESTGFFVPLAGDASDGTLPAAGTPCPIFSYSDNGWGTGFSDAVNIYQMAVNWVPTTPTATITLAGNVPTAAFDATYNSTWNDVSQPGTTQMLDGIGGVCMFRAQWKTWSGYNTVVLNWAVKISATQRSIKWCELRQNQSTGVWSMYQEGTYTPDTDTRWMGSIAMDNNGSIALAYMKSNSTSTYPGLYYTGRRSCDPLGTLPITETTAIAGTGSQTGINRDGDYADLVLDPDGVTFWYTGEYMGGATGNSAAKTQIFSFQIASCTTAASVFVSSTATTICAGNSVTFTATPTNGGTAPSYQWQVNGSNVGTNSATYTTSTLTNGQIVSCVMTSNMAGVTGNPATSNSVTIAVAAQVVPSVSISASSTTICAGTLATFTATPTNGGAAPSYQWKVNGVNAGTNSNTFSTTTLTNGQVVTCMMTSNATCPSPATATSNGIAMSVTTATTPTVSVALTTGTNPECIGSATTFTATPNNAVSPSYQWKLNGTNVGTNSTIYSNTSLANNDIVTCVMTASSTCPVSVTLGTGTTANITTSDVGAAYPSYYGNGRQQYLIKASELTALGLTAGNISSLGFTVTGSAGNPATMNGYSIKLATTAATALTTTFQAPSFTTVFGPVNYTPTLNALNTHTLSTPFNWDGVSNILVNICFSNSVTGSAAYQTYQTSSSFVSTTYYQADGTAGAGACSQITGSTASMRPNITFTKGTVSASSNAVTMIVNALPTINVSSTATSVCAGTSVTLTGNGASTYSWTGGVTNGTAFTPSATTTYTVTGTDVNGCTNTSTKTITVNPLPTVSATATATSVCTGTSVTLTGNGASTYSWTGGVTNGTAFTPSATTTYTVTGTDVNGCTNTSTKTIVVNPLPTVSTTATATSVCTGTSVTLTGSGASTYSWTGGVTNGTAFTPSSTTTYTVTGTDVNGCTNTSTKTITLNPLPTVSATATATSVCTGTSVTLTGTGASTYSWTGGVTNGTAFTPSATTTYTVTGTDVNGCSNTYTKTISVLPNFNITASVGTGGSISPNGITIVCSGNSQSYLITASSGYQINDVLVDGISNAAAITSGSYTFNGVASSHTISASFIPNCSAPIITCPANINVNSDANQCGTAVSFVATASGTTPLITYSQNSGTIFPVGTTTVIATATNSCGVANCSFNITVIDATAPVPNVASLPTLTGECSVTATAPTASDNCSGNITATTTDPLTYTVQGTYTIHWLYADANGNSSSQNQIVIVNDVTPPVLTCPSDITVCGDQHPSLGTPTATDNCAGAVTVTNNAPATFAFGTTTVIWTATDARGNSSTCSQLVTVNQIPVGSVNLSGSNPNYQTICSGSAGLVPLTSTVSGSNFSWTATTQGSIIGASNSNGFAIQDILSNIGNVHGTVIYTITPTANGCSGVSFMDSVRIGVVPAKPSTVSGPAVVCTLVPVNTASYSIASVPEATSYQWTMPTGVTITSGQGTANIVSTVATGTVTVAGYLTVRATNACGSSSLDSLYITKKPKVPGTISGPISLCGATTATYSVTPVSGATSYLWTLPTGIAAVGSATGASINVSVTTSFISGNITATAVNACGNTAGTPLMVYGKAPVAPVTVTGPTNVCGLSTATYVVTAVMGTSSYNWTVPAGITIVSGQGMATIHVSFSGYTTGNITVKASNVCGTSAAKTVTLSRTVTAPGAISGPYAICGLTTATYSIAAVAGVTAYNWTVPAGVTITSNAGTSITVSFGATATGGNISVTTSNGCTTSAAKSLAIAKINAPGTITGTATVCGGGSFTYTIPAVTGATSYIWVVPTGWVITSGQGTTSITAAVPAGTLAASIVKVAAVNSCGTSGYQSKAISACAGSITINNGSGKEKINSFSSVYPNPTSGEFTIDVTMTDEQLTTNNQQLTIEVYDVLGNKVISRKHSIASGLTSIKTSIENFNNGIYFVRLIDVDNNSIFTERVIKQ